MSDNIYLVGFMAAGKSTVGRALAKALNRRFVDMDELLEHELGSSIAEAFSRRGEAAFRVAESALLRTLSNRRRLVVAAGGGAPESKKNRRIMRRSGQVVHLAADLETCTARLTPGERAARPLWKDEKSLRRLFERRQQAFAACDVTVRVDGHGPEAIAQMIIANVIPEERFSVALGQSECLIISTYRAPEVLSEFFGARKTAVLTDSNVHRLHLDRYGVASTASLLVSVRPGERSKSLNQARRVYEALGDRAFHRDDVLVAVGGGVVTDLGAYIASTYMRGMGLVMVATTLLGCADAAIGGKAAVNLGRVKNLVGSFSIPLAVILDVAAFQTLKPHHIREGLIEAYKTGLVAAPELVDFVETELPSLLRGDQALLARAAVLSARAKASVVSQDFRESGLRRILNLGHTLGHAVEGLTRFKASHGAAVALGVMAAAELSRARGMLSYNVFDRIVQTVCSIFRTKPPLPPVDEAWLLMSQDKKVRSDRLVFVLLEGKGRAVCVDDVSRSEMAQALRAVESILNDKVSTGRDREGSTEMNR